MSAALQLPAIWGGANARTLWPAPAKREELRAAEPDLKLAQAALALEESPDEGGEDGPCISLAFYRKHTEKMLRRYLYASMQVGRTPAVLGDPIGRGWASSRKVTTFEDAVVFVLDIETCLKKLTGLHRMILNRLVIQEYTHGEVADMLGISLRTMGYKYHQALDRMTELLLEADLLDLPK